MSGAVGTFMFVLLAAGAGLARAGYLIAERELKEERVRRRAITLSLDRADVRLREISDRLGNEGVAPRLAGLVEYVRAIAVVGQSFHRGSRAMAVFALAGVAAALATSLAFVDVLNDEGPAAEPSAAASTPATETPTPAPSEQSDEPSERPSAVATETPTPTEEPLDESESAAQPTPREHRRCAQVLIGLRHGRVAGVSPVPCPSLATMAGR